MDNLPNAYAGKLMQEVRDLGHYPKKSQIRSLAEQLLAEKLRWARKAKKVSPEQEAELKALQEVEIDSSEKARQGGELLFCQKRKR